MQVGAVASRPWHAGATCRPATSYAAPYCRPCALAVEQQLLLSSTSSAAARAREGGFYRGGLAVAAGCALTARLRRPRGCTAHRGGQSCANGFSALTRRAAASAGLPPNGGMAQLEPGRHWDWCAVYINLARRPDRRAQLAKTLAPGNPVLLCKLERIDAVDGQQLDLHDGRLRGVVSDEALKLAQEAHEAGAFTIIHQEGQLVRFHNHLTRGGVACALSHRAALEAVASHPTAKWGLILEDDVSGLVPNVHEVIKGIIERLPSNWDALFIGYHGGALAGRAPPEGDQEFEKEVARARFELQMDDMRGPTEGFYGSMDGEEFGASGEWEPPLLRMYLPLFGLYAWVVRKEAARAALDTGGVFPISGQVDHALSQWLVTERGRCFRVAPRHMLLFSPKSEEGLDSDIQTMARLDDLVEDPEMCERYMAFVNRNAEVE